MAMLLCTSAILGQEVSLQKRLLFFSSHATVVL